MWRNILRKAPMGRNHMTDTQLRPADHIGRTWFFDFSCRKTQLSVNLESMCKFKNLFYYVFRIGQVCPSIFYQRCGFLLLMLVVANQTKTCCHRPLQSSVWVPRPQTEATGRKMISTFAFPGTQGLSSEEFILSPDGSVMFALFYMWVMWATEMLKCPGQGLGDVMITDSRAELKCLVSKSCWLSPIKVSCPITSGRFLCVKSLVVKRLQQLE